MLFGIICLILGAGVFAYAVYISTGNSKGDDERFKESIGNMCWGAIIASLLLCGMFAIDTDSKKNNRRGMLLSDRMLRGGQQYGK